MFYRPVSERPPWSETTLSSGSALAGAGDYRHPPLRIRALKRTEQSGSRQTQRWREMDSNRRSPAEFGNFDVSRKGPGRREDDVPR
jgi:hypothetical protein